MRRDDEGRPRQDGPATTEKNATEDMVARARARVAEMYARRRWESYWRRQCDEIDNHAIARKVAEVDRGAA